MEDVVDNEIDNVLLKFIKDCGGFDFVSMIASGDNLRGKQHVIIAAKNTVCKILQIKEDRKRANKVAMKKQ